MTNTSVFRLRLCFVKQGRLKWLSHLELIRALERCIRRSGLPYQLSQGFNRHMKHSFGPALPVGTAGLQEYCDLWLEEYLAPDLALNNLQAVAVDDLPILTCEYINKDAPSLQISHCLATYQIVLQSESEGDAWQEVFSSALAGQLQAGEFILMKKGKTKVFDLHKTVVAWQLDADRPLLMLTLRLSNEGSLRPELFLAPLLSQLPGVSLGAITRVALAPEAQS